jgi:DNA-directed RNA polymerase specialized sigma subunit
MIDRDALYRNNLGLIGYVLSLTKRNTYNFSYANIYDAAYNGYVDAIMSYSEDYHVQFDTFAICRIRGSIFDYIRQEVCRTKLSLTAKEWQFEIRHVSKYRQQACEKKSCIDVAAFRRNMLAECRVLF